MSNNLQKLLLVNNFLRSFCLNLSLLYSASLFIAHLGSKSFSGIFFISTIAVIFIYVLIILQKEISSYLTYAVITGSLLIVSILQGVYFDSTSLIFLYAVSVLATDVISGTINGNLIQSIVPGSSFPAIFQKQVTVDLVAKIVASLMIWLSVEFQLLQVVPLLIWLFLGGHVATFTVIVKRYVTRDRKSLSSRRKIRDFVDSITFVKDNALIRSIIILMAWTFAAKFLVENIFYIGLNQEYSGVSEVSSLISITSFLTIIGTLIFQRVSYRFFGLNPSTLLSFLPIGIMALLIGTMVYKSILPFIALFVFFKIFNTSLQIPITRRCLLPLPDSRKKNIVTLTFLVASVSSLIVSGLLSLFKQYLDLPHYSVLLILCTIPVFFVLVDFDHHYIGNLWNQFKENVNKEWAISSWLAPYSSIGRKRIDLESTQAINYNMSGIDEETKGKVEDIVQGYQTFDSNILHDTVHKHHRLLHHSDSSKVIQGIRLIGDLSISHLFPFLWDLKNSQNIDVSNAALKEIYIDSIFGNLNTDDLRCHTKRKIKSVLRQNLGKGDDEVILAKISQLLALDFKKTIANFIEMLEVYDYHDSPCLWNCLSADGIDLKPFVNAMVEHDYESADEYRSVLRHLDLRTAVLFASRDLINEFTGQLMKNKFSFWRELDDPKSSDQIRIFQHALFLQLFYMRSDPSFDLVLDSIKDINRADDDQKSMLKQVHLTALAGSYNVSLWKYFYTKMTAA